MGEYGENERSQEASEAEHPDSPCAQQHTPWCIDLCED